MSKIIITQFHFSLTSNSKDVILHVTVNNWHSGLDTVSLRTPTCDAGVDFSFFIDTTLLAKSIVKKNSKPVIDITEIDNPADWVFNKPLARVQM